MKKVQILEWTVHFRLWVEDHVQDHSLKTVSYVKAPLQTEDRYNERSGVPHFMLSYLTLKHILSALVQHLQPHI